MKKTEKVFKLMKEKRLTALLTPRNLDECLTAYEIFSPLGIVLEIALRSEVALDGIKAVIKKYPDALILAGTVMTKSQAKKAIEAGASGIISADYIPSVVEACLEADIMCVPGGLTDAGKQLVQKADFYGLELNELKEKYPYQWIYKLFPAATGKKLNVDLSLSWKGPYKDLTVIYAGGVSLENLEEMVRNDPQGIFCGSALLEKIASPNQMEEEAKKWLEVIHPGQGREKEKAEPKAGRKRSGSKARVVTFGEILLRLSPPHNLRFLQAKNLEMSFGGAEANVAVALANYGLDSCFVTALPENEIGQAALNHLRAYGVETKNVLRQGKRVGIYFLESGASQRQSKVIYDREGSSISEIRLGMIDWEKIFEKATWFHWSGITPSLSDSAREALSDALKAARQSGLTVSVDLNYRKKLWPKEKAQKVMTELMEYVDIAMGNEEDAENIFGIKAGKSDVRAGKLDIDGYKEACLEMIKRFGLKKVGITLRESITASDNLWSACLSNGEEFYESKKYKVHVVDRIGAGDSFSSGLIYGIMSGKADKEALEFATAASCLKQTIPGDSNLSSLEEVEALAGGESSGRIER